MIRPLSEFSDHTPLRKAGSDPDLAIEIDKSKTAKAV